MIFDLQFFDLVWTSLDLLIKSRDKWCHLTDDASWCTLRKYNDSEEEAHGDDIIQKEFAKVEIGMVP